MTSAQIAHNWCAIVIRHRCQYTLEAIVVSYIHHHDVSTEKVNAVALKKLPATLQVVGAVLYFCPLVNVRELRCLFGGGES